MKSRVLDGCMQGNTNITRCWMCKIKTSRSLRVGVLDGKKTNRTTLAKVLLYIELLDCGKLRTDTSGAELGYKSQCNLIN